MASRSEIHKIKKTPNTEATNEHESSLLIRFSFVTICIQMTTNNYDCHFFDALFMGCAVCSICKVCTHVSFAIPFHYTWSGFRCQNRMYAKNFIFFLLFFLFRLMIKFAFMLTIWPKIVVFCLRYTKMLSFFAWRPVRWILLINYCNDNCDAMPFTRKDQNRSRCVYTILILFLFFFLE